MYRGETLTTTVKGFPIPIADIDQLYIVYKTGTEVLMEKTLQDCTIDGESVKFDMTQEESLKLRCGPIMRGVVVVGKDGARFESHPSPFYCGQTMKDEVL